MMIVIVKKHRKHTLIMVMMRIIIITDVQRASSGNELYEKLLDRKLWSLWGKKTHKHLQHINEFDAQTWLSRVFGMPSAVTLHLTYLTFYIYTRPSRSLRSSEDTRILTVPKFNCKTKGDRPFSNFAAKSWNYLLWDIRQADSLDTFKSKLKAYLFTVHFTE